MLKQPGAFFYRGGSVLAVVAIVFGEGTLDCFAGLTGAFLDASHEFVFFAFDELEVIIGEVRPALFYFAFGDVPISFDLKLIHFLFPLDLGFFFYGQGHIKILTAKPSRANSLRMGCAKIPELAQKVSGEPVIKILRRFLSFFDRPGARIDEAS